MCASAASRFDRSTETGRVTIVTGCPGTGKTTLSLRLASSGSLGLRLEVDAFYSFLAHPLSPVLPESQAQNTAVCIATARAARAFAEHGYQVFVDGVVGPWFLPVFARELVGLEAPVEYGVVRASLDETVRRATTRPDGDKFEVDGVKHMHAAFADLGAFESHVIDTEGRTADETLAEIERRLSTGELRLDCDRSRTPVPGGWRAGR